MYDLVERVQVYLTGKCNLRCKHCYMKPLWSVGIEGDDYTQLKYLLRAFDKPVDLSGGEIFMYNFRDLLTDFFNEGIKVSSIFTNGTLVEHFIPVLQKLYKLSAETAFFVSLDGYGDAHEAFRGKGTFVPALRGASLLKQIGFPVHINTMLHKYTSLENLRELFNVVKSLQADRWRLDIPFNAGNWRNHRAQFEITLKRSIELFAQILDLWFSEGQPFEIEMGHVLKFIAGRYYFMDYYNEEDSVCPCRTLPIWPDGTITWCQNLWGPQYTIGTIYTDPNEIYHKYRQFKEITVVEVAQRIGTCRECEHLPYCGTGCRANALLGNGSYFSPDPEMCTLYKSHLYVPISQVLLKHFQGNEQAGP